ncbi:MAG TPA: rhomboid family intramembrane serine protease [Bacteroidales bacterium]|nr:rhomboid family intramembrane serine protease [Bacteroidales bacterium]HRT89283.1 rhomboid family intramembrane serine protease [Bacteroidales bacterium]
MGRDDEEIAVLRKKLLLSFLIPALLVFLMWFVKITELAFEADFTRLGVYPLRVNGLPGIIFSPLIHSDFSHLISNSLPFLLLGTALFYFYSEPALKIFTWNYFITGLLVWLTGRPAWHIGASGVVYGLMSFLFFSGIIRRYYRLTALSLLVVFLYGSMVWGMFPDVYKDVSWEAHSMGFITGIFLAIAYRNEGPRRPVYEWMEEEEMSDEYTDPEIEKDKPET